MSERMAPIGESPTRTRVCARPTQAPIAHATYPPSPATLLVYFYRRSTSCLTGFLAKVAPSATPSESFPSFLNVHRKLRIFYLENHVQWSAPSDHAEALPAYAELETLQYMSLTRMSRPRKHTAARRRIAYSPAFSGRPSRSHSAWNKVTPSIVVATCPHRHHLDFTATYRPPLTVGSHRPAPWFCASCLHLMKILSARPERSSYVTHPSPR